jgi:hypothetical protein
MQSINLMRRNQDSIGNRSNGMAHSRRAWPGLVKALMFAAAVVSGLYAGYVAVTWYRYGRNGSFAGSDIPSRIDRFMPTYEVREVHQTNVAAPPNLTFAAAQRMDLQHAPLVRAIFAVRSLPGRLRGERPVSFSEGLLAETRAIGWGTLSETPGQEVIMGAVTRPWESTPTFHALSPERFADFNEPGYAKIIWTLAAEPRGEGQSVFLTETRVQTTDPDSRERFRKYWATLSPGILLIRLQALDLVKTEAEALARGVASASVRMAQP